MKGSHLLSCVCLTIVLVACGGGGGKGKPAKPAPTAPTLPPPAPPPPSAKVAISTSPIAQEFALGDVQQLSLAGTWSASNLGTAQVYLEVADNANTFVVPAVQLAPAGNAFNYALPIGSQVGVGLYSGTLTVRACQDALCTQPYANAITSIDYRLQVNPLGEWETMQRNASHNGFVGIRLDPSKFTKAWEWRLSTANVGAINPVVTSDGSVYISSDVSGQAELYSLDEASGAVRWNASLATSPILVPSVNPPAVSNGQVYLVITDVKFNVYLLSFDATTGAAGFRSLLHASDPRILAPTVYDNGVYTSGGYTNGGINAFDRDSGVRLWVGGAPFASMSTPAADANHIYNHTGAALEILERRTGATVASIIDPSGQFAGSYYGAPAIGGRGNIIAFSGSTPGVSRGSNAEQIEQRELSSFDIVGRKWQWATKATYLTTPAIAKGVIYAGRNAPMALDAIDESTGKVLWSWAPAGMGDSEFHRNIIATSNLLFVSTDKSVYALDLATRQVVWRYPEPGMLAISANQTLYIATGARESDGRLVAIKLR